MTTTLCTSMAWAGCVEKLPDDGRSAGGIPLVVQRELDASCAIAGCHVAGFTSPNLSAGASAGTIGRESSTGIPYVTFGSLEQSYLAHKLLGEDAPRPITGTVMPPGSRLPETSLAILLGWILVGNDPFASDEGDTDSATSTETGETVAGETVADETTSETGVDPDPSETSETTGSALISHDRDIQPIWEEQCSGPTCHLHANPIRPPDLTAGKAYDNIVNVIVPMLDGSKYVSPYDYEGSYIWRKINGGPMIGGAKMPITGREITPTQRSRLEQWILEGAPR